MTVDDGAGEDPVGVRVPAAALSHRDLLRELEHLHQTRHDTLRHGSDQALLHHDTRMAELEGEYLRRFPQREIDPERLRSGARERPHTPPRTGADQPWDPEDVAVAEGHDPTPRNVAWARRKLAEEGRSAIERTVP